MPRPLIAVPGRFSAAASALRFGAVVNARKLLEAVYQAGGEPLTVHPHAPGGVVTPEEIAARLHWADGLLLPGGGDLDPRRYGQEVASEHLYDLDEEQDGFDLAAGAWAAQAGVPVFAICRGLQVMNALRGGDLEQHMDDPHRHVTQSLTAAHPILAQILGAEEVKISCYHHQRIGRLGSNLTPAAVAGDGTVEAVLDWESGEWLLGVQWHPEDTAGTDAAQARLFEVFVEQAARRSEQR